jgi:hypothetical protein
MDLFAKQRLNTLVTNDLGAKNHENPSCKLTVRQALRTGRNSFNMILINRLNIFTFIAN